MSQDRKDQKNLQVSQNSQSNIELSKDKWKKIINGEYTSILHNEVMYTYKNLHKPNVIGIIDVFVHSGKKVMINAYCSDSDENIPEYIRKAFEDEKLEQPFTRQVTSNMREDPKQIIKFLNILNKFERFDFEEILQNTGIPAPLKEVENALLSAVTKCDLKAIGNAIVEMKEINIPIDFNKIRNSRGEALLMLAASGSRNIPHGQSYEVVKLLLGNGADPLTTSNDGRTALMEAANFGRVSVVDLLLDNVPLDKRIAYINQKDDVGTAAVSGDVNPRKNGEEKWLQKCA